jgi:hypothetical protein
VIERLARLLRPRWRVAAYSGDDRLVPGFTYYRYRRALAEAGYHQRLEILNKPDASLRLAWRVTREHPRAQSPA